MVRIIIIALLLSSCADFERKMYEAQQLQCAPPIHSICEPNESLLICNTADKKECYGWLIEE
jgi:hypothetical protein